MHFDLIQRFFLLFSDVYPAEILADRKRFFKTNFLHDKHNIISLQRLFITLETGTSCKRTFINLVHCVNLLGPMNCLSTRGNNYVLLLDLAGKPRGIRCLSILMSVVNLLISKRRVCLFSWL